MSKTSKKEKSSKPATEGQEVNDGIRDGVSALYNRMMGLEDAGEEQDQPGLVEQLQDSPQLESETEAETPETPETPDEPESTDEPEESDTQEDPEEPEQPEAPEQSRIEPEPTNSGFDADELARAIAQGNEGLIKEIAKRDAPSRPQQQAAELPEAVKKHKALYDKMAEMFPDKYQDLTRKMADFARKEEAYAKRWEDKNDAPFDAASEDHNEWYEANMPRIDDEDRTEAKIQMRVDAAVAKIERKNRQEVDGVRKELKAKEFSQNFSSVKESIKDPMAKVFDAESMAELQARDAAAAKFLNKAVEGVFSTLEEAAKLDQDLVEYDPGNMVHRAVSDVLGALEESVGKLPKANRQRHGKMFATREEFAGMTKKQRDSHWTITEEDIRNAIVHQIALEARKTYEEMKSLFGDLSPQANGKQTATQKQETQQAPGFLSDSAATSKDKQVSVKSRTHINNPKPSKQEAPKTGVDMFTQRLLGS